jgi:filamentous hemagglutinin family protein
MYMLKKYCLIFLYFSSCSVVFNSLALPSKGEVLSVLIDGTTQTNITGSRNCTADCTILGGSRAGDNLFHSFSEFSIPENVTAIFKDDGATSIFIRVSEKASFINGTLAVTGEGNASFFLLNPNGINFGANAALASSGSFVASTANSIVFSDKVRFDAENTESALLTVNTPIGFQFGSSPGVITNRSQASPEGALNILGEPVGLQVDSGKTLALIGGNIFLEGGSLTANGGQISIGSVAANSEVSFSPNFTLGYENTPSFQDVYLTRNALIDTSGNQGRISIRARNIAVANRSAIANFTIGSALTGSIQIHTDEDIKITGGGIFFSPLLDSMSNGAEVDIFTNRLILKDGAVISGGTFGSGNGGNLFIRASKSVELSGTSIFSPSLITTSTEGQGSGGNIIINTQQLIVREGAQIETVTYGPGEGGDLTINATDRVEVRGFAEDSFSEKFTSGLRASSGVEGLPFQPTGVGGNLTINTHELVVSDRAQIAVNSLGSGDSGNLNITARAVRLHNHAQLTASAAFGNGGNLYLNDVETLVLRRGSTVSTRAGVGDGLGNGGNIFIDADFIVTGLLEDADIVAKATQGRGGNIEINTQGLYGIERRRAIARNGTNDIDASSEFGISGTTAINQLVVEAPPSWLTLAQQTLEATSSVSSQCDATGNRFVVTARGGIPIRPSEGAESSASLVDLGEETGGIAPVQNASLAERSLAENRKEIREEGEEENQRSEHPVAWIEASGWRTNENHQVVLTAPSQQNASLFQPTAATCSG